MLSICILNTKYFTKIPNVIFHHKINTPRNFKIIKLKTKNIFCDQFTFVWNYFIIISQNIQKIIILMTTNNIFQPYN